MNRRKFILASGTTVLTGISTTKQPVTGLDFEISTTPRKDPSSVDSVLVDFSQFKLKPRYINSSEDLTVSVELSLDGIDSTQVQQNIPVKKEIDKGDIGSELPLYIDGINTEQDSIDGEVKIVVSHPDLDSQTYRRQFEIRKNRIGVIDDFEDGSIGEYTQLGGSGSFTAQKSTVQEGTYAGKLTADENYTTTQYYSDSGLDRYPKAGDTFRFWMKDDGYNVGVNFGVSDPGGQTINDGYRFIYNAGGPEYQLYSVVNGSSTLVAEDALEHSDQIWREVEVKWGQNGSFTIIVYDTSGNKIQQFSGSNSDHKAGGFGWSVRGSSGAPTSGWFDNARVTSFSN